MLAQFCCVPCYLKHREPQIHSDFGMHSHSNNCSATQRQKRQMLKDHIDAPEEDADIDSTKRQKLKDAGGNDLKDGVTKD